jgi:hypothetical protein
MEVSLVSIDRKGSAISPVWLGDFAHCQRASHPLSCRDRTHAAYPSHHYSYAALNEQHHRSLKGARVVILDRADTAHRLTLCVIAGEASPRDQHFQPPSLPPLSARTSLLAAIAFSQQQPPRAVFLPLLHLKRHQHHPDRPHFRPSALASSARVAAPRMLPSPLLWPALLRGYPLA